MKGTGLGRRLVCGAMLALLTLLLAGEARVARAAPARKLELRRETLSLPGPPASLVPADLNGDGLRDLAAVVAYTEWDEIGMDRFEGLVQVTTIVPALFDRRELRAWLAEPGGGYREAAPPLPLPTSVLTLEEGPPGLPLVALTDEGLSAVRLNEGAEGPTLELVPLLEDPPVLAGSETFLPELSLVRELDGDGTPDLALPAREGPALYLGTGRGLRPEPASRLELPGDRRRARRGALRLYPFPTAQDMNGDGLPDLLVREPGASPPRYHLLLGTGGGRFAEPVALEVPRPDPVKVSRKKREDTFYPEVAFLGDVRGDGRAEAISSIQVDTGKSEMKQAKRPRFLFRFHELGEDLALESEPYYELEVEGYGSDEEFEGSFISGFRDLDADGRLDLVSITLRFSIFQVLRVLTTKSVSVGLDFHVYAQQEDGSFREVPDLDLSEKLKLDLNDLSLGRLAQFRGDFDGDGLVDFVHLGRGEKVTVHRGQPGCRYPKKPDLTLILQAPVEDLAQVRVLDLDGDGADDLVVARPRPPDEPGVTGEVILDLYLLGGSAARGPEGGRP
jgi:hypothetical protein